MEERNPIPAKKEESLAVANARNEYLFEEAKKQQERNLKRKQFQEEQSFREGLRYLLKATCQFILFVATGAYLLFLSRSMIKTDSAKAVALVVIAAWLILKGMMSFGGFRSK